jgi:hypothetical protein
MPERATRFVGLTIVAAAIFLVGSAPSYLKEFDGEAWRLFGDVIDGEVGH